MTPIAKARTAALALTTLALLLMEVVHVAVQTSGDLFDGRGVYRVDLYVNADDWQDVRANPVARRYHPATLKSGAAIARNVGVRSDAATPHESPKPRLHVDADWYAPGLTFHDLRDFTLDNLADDPSGIRRVLTSRFYRRLGLPAPRAAHVALFVNNTFTGIYVIRESMDTAFAASAAINRERPGRLYRYTSRVPYRMDYLGGDLDAYLNWFRSPGRTDRISADDFAILDDMIRGVNGGTGAIDESRLGRYVDVRLLARLAAVQAFLGEPDGLLGRDGMRNFSVNIRGRGDPLQIVPDGGSLGLLDPNYPIDEGLTGSTLAREAFGSPTLLRTYVDAVVAAAHEADSRDSAADAAGWLESEVGREQRLLRSAVAADPNSAWSAAEMQRDTARLSAFARARGSFVRCEVARLQRRDRTCRADAVTGVVQSSAVPEPISTLQRAGPAALAVMNVARGRPYTLTPRPNYALTSDAGDDLQLTDGEYTFNRPIWTRATTVGWINATPATIVIDLGTIQPIAGVSVSTAAGTAEVEWPRSIFVLVSDDGERFFWAADLVATPASAARSSAGYATFRFTTHDLATHGRYVALLVDPTGPYTFADEIEVFRGDPTWLRTALDGESTRDLQNFFLDAHMRVSIQQRLAADLAAVTRALERADITSTLRDELARQLSSAESEIETVPLQPAASFKATLPVNATHARILAVHGALRQASGYPALSAWTVGPWDFVRPTDPPPTANVSATLSIAAMTGETRSGTLNFSNATGRATTVRIRLADLPGFAESSELGLFEVAWTDTRELIPVADALVPLPDGTASFSLPAGMTRQLWFRFAPANRPPGVSRGFVEATTGDGFRVRVPIELTVLSGRFPERPRLHVGGWDYTDSEIYGLTATNRDALIRQLQEVKADSPWATGNVMPPGSYDARGQLAAPPDTSVFDRWVSKWRGANRYLVFVNAGDRLGNVSIGNDRFPTAVEQWITFWVSHAASRGIQPSQLLLLLVDEPRSGAQDDRIVTWARAIKASAAGVRIWENPTYPDPAAANPQLLDLSDVLAMKRSLMLQHGAAFVDVFRERRARGQAIEVYGAHGPARLLDPYTYYRLQAWVCADVGATGSAFWSFADDAGGSSWNEYATTATPYSPFFLSADTVASSKHVEAIREGVEDFEYLAMLRDRVDELGRTTPNHPALAEARQLLDVAVRSVLDAPGATEMEWMRDKDRSAAERVRLAIATVLERLRN